MGAILFLALLQDKEPELNVGEVYRITVRVASWQSEPSCNADPMRPVKYAEHAKLLELVKKGKVRWAKCQLEDGKTGYITANNLLSKKEFKKLEEGNEETAAGAAESYRGSRFDPGTEDKFSATKDYSAAYKQVDEWCGRPEAKYKDHETGQDKHRAAMPGKPGWKNNRADMQQVLRTFRAAGKLGEFQGN
jgi:hypothetical protein